MSLTLDLGTEGEILVRLPVFWNLVEVIPNKGGCANLTGDVLAEVGELVVKWEKRGWVKGVYESHPGDFLSLDPERADLSTLLAMVAEWYRLQLSLRPPSPGDPGARPIRKGWVFLFDNGVYFLLS